MSNNKSNNNNTTKVVPIAENTTTPRKRRSSITILFALEAKPTLRDDAKSELLSTTKALVLMIPYVFLAMINTFMKQKLFAISDATLICAETSMLFMFLGALANTDNHSMKQRMMATMVYILCLTILHFSLNCKT